MTRQPQPQKRTPTMKLHPSKSYQISEPHYRLLEERDKARLGAIEAEQRLKDLRFACDAVEHVHFIPGFSEQARDDAISIIVADVLGNGGGE